MSTALRRSRNQPKRCRGDIAGNVEIPRLGNLLAENANGAVIFRCRAHQEIIEHLLHLFSPRERHLTRGLAFRTMDEQEQCSDHKCALIRFAVYKSAKE